LQKANQAAIIKNERLGEVFVYVTEWQKAFEYETRSKKAPHRRTQAKRHILKPV
jgi:hypothetical protein